MYRFYQIFKRDFLNLLINPMWIFFGTAYPFLLVLILGFLSSGAYGSSITGYDYYGVSMMIYIILNTSTVAANSFMEERIKKGNMRMIYSPVPKNFIYISKIAATFVFSSLGHLLVMLILNLVFKVNYGGERVGFIIIIFLMLELFSSILGIMFCCIFKEESITNQILSMAITILGVMGGLFFSLDGFGEAVEKLSFISPVKWIATNVFRVIYDKDFSYYLPAVSILMVLSLVGLLLCQKFYNTEDYI